MAAAPPPRRQLTRPPAGPVSDALGIPYEAGSTLPTEKGALSPPFLPPPPHGTWEVEAGPT
eukprot:15469631-Alexandrium_andersonii.AAC.1